MRLLQCLARRAGAVVSIDELLDEVWAGIIVTPDSVYQAVASLRRSLGDDPKQPTYIATVPRLGYRMVARVEPYAENTATVTDPTPAATHSTPLVGHSSTRGQGLKLWMAWAAFALLAMVGAAIWLTVHNDARPRAVTVAVKAQPDAKSVAVLPFLDLTDDMKEEPFADGMTEELIDKLSKVRGLHVPAPTSSFFYKDKQFTIANIARALNVAYVLDGSVRKSGTTLRVAARLVRADDGFVVWSETYDRSWSDKLMIQDDIASEVTKALETSIH